MASTAGSTRTATVPAPAGSQAVDRAAALLVSVVESPEPRSFTSLVDEIGLARSTTSRLLQALERNRLVQRDRSGAFRAGSVFATFAVRHDRLGDLADLAQPTLDRLGELTGETINLAVPDGTEIVQVSQVDGRHVLGAMNWLDVDVPAALLGGGQAVLRVRLDAAARPGRSPAVRPRRSRWPSSGPGSGRSASRAGPAPTRSWSPAWSPSPHRSGTPTARSSPASRCPGRSSG